MCISRHLVPPVLKQDPQRISRKLTMVSTICHKAAKENGSKVCVLVSSMGANASSPFLYMKTKGELEDDIIKLGLTTP